MDDTKIARQIARNRNDVQRWAFQFTRLIAYRRDANASRYRDLAVCVGGVIKYDMVLKAGSESHKLRTAWGVTCPTCDGAEVTYGEPCNFCDGKKYVTLSVARGSSNFIESIVEYQDKEYEDG